MPIFNILNFTTKNLILWKISENESQLAESIYLSNSEKSKFNSIKSSVKRKHFLAIKNILKMLKIDFGQVTYKQSGKPEIKDKYISISHSYDYCGVIVSEKKVGIDIEKFRPKIERIKNKFISEKEKSLIDDLSIENLTKVWTIKEAVFKAFGHNSIDFKKNIIIKKINRKFDKAIVEINKKSIVEYYILDIVNFSQYICSVAQINDLNLELD